MTNELLRIEHLSKKYKKKLKDVPVLNDISFSMMEEEWLGLIGESGSGKSTIAKLIAGFEKPDEGQIYFNGKSLIGQKNSKDLRKEMQVIFQDPRSSLNPRMTIAKNMDEAMIYISNDSKKERLKQIEEMIRRIGLPLAYLKKYPHELSGGECQRICIGRALLRKPKFLICDEATSALDVSVQKDIIMLLMDLQKQFIMGILFISHDLALVSQVCSRIIVLENGKIAET